MLREAERHGKEGEEEPERRSRERRDRDAGPEVGPEISRHPARHRPRGEDALDPEIEYAGTLAQGAPRTPNMSGVAIRTAAAQNEAETRISSTPSTAYPHRTWKRTKRLLTSTHKSESATMRSAM